MPGLEKGRIFSGRQAQDLSLIDEIGGEAEAVRWLEKRRRQGPQGGRLEARRDSSFGFGAVAEAIAGLFGEPAAVARIVLGERTNFIAWS